MNVTFQALLLAYAASAAGVLVGLLVLRVQKRAMFRWPLYSFGAMALGVLTWTMLRKHVLPPAWAQLHAQTLYYCALGLYSVLGLGLGLLIGRIIGRKTTASNAEETP